MIDDNNYVGLPPHPSLGSRKMIDSMKRLDGSPRTMDRMSKVEFRRQQRQQEQQKQEHLTVCLGHPLPDLKAHADLYVPDPHHETKSLLEISFKRTIRVVSFLTSSFPPPPLTRNSHTPK